MAPPDGAPRRTVVDIGRGHVRVGSKPLRSAVPTFDRHTPSARNTARADRGRTPMVSVSQSPPAVAGQPVAQPVLTPPAALHPFSPLDGGRHRAAATPGDLLFHIRAATMDLCWELASLVCGRLAGAATVVDEVHGFKYFDERDLLGFVDGTENPTGTAAEAAVTIGTEDPAFTGGSYVIVQKYLHDMAAWDALRVEEQERVIGRAKLSNVEMNDDVKPSNSHVALNTIVEADGTQRQILRENMPFGSLGAGDFGTYFIGYASTPSVTELMLQRMFLGHPPGNYDRILDFSTAVTGTLFFVPTGDFLDDPPPLPGQAEQSGADEDG